MHQKGRAARQRLSLSRAATRLSEGRPLVRTPHPEKPKKNKVGLKLHSPCSETYTTPFKQGHVLATNSRFRGIRIWTGVHSPNPVLYVSNQHPPGQFCQISVKATLTMTNGSLTCRASPQITVIVPIQPFGNIRLFFISTCSHIYSKILGFSHKR